VGVSKSVEGVGGVRGHFVSHGVDLVGRGVSKSVEGAGWGCRGDSFRRALIRLGVRVSKSVERVGRGAGGFVSQGVDLVGVGCRNVSNRAGRGWAYGRVAGPRPREHGREILSVREMKKD
jgi:hypothetical protein